MAAEIAHITGSRLLVDEIPKMVSQRLNRSIGELDALAASSRSVWTRMLRSVASHWEQYGSMDDSYTMFDPRLSIGFEEPLGYLTRKEYLEGFGGVVTELALEGNVVMCGIGTNRFVPSKSPAFRLLVTSSEASREKRIAEEFDLTLTDAKERRAHLDRDSLAIARYLYDFDLLDVDSYDLVLNVERMTHTRAAESIAAMLGALGGGSAATRRGLLTAVR